MTKIYSTLGRKFNKKDLEEAQRMGTELVYYFNCNLNMNTFTVDNIVIKADRKSNQCLGKRASAHKNHPEKDHEKKTCVLDLEEEIKDHRGGSQ